MLQGTTSWQDTIKAWKAAQTTENLPSRQQMIRAVTRTIQILDTKIKQHADAIDNLYGKHRMDSKNQDIVDAILVLQKEMTKLYAAKQSLTKHRLVLAKDSVKFNVVPQQPNVPAPAVTPTPIIQKPSLMQAIKQKIVLAAAAAGVPWVEEDHKRDHGKFAKKDGGDDTPQDDKKDGGNNSDVSDNIKKHLDDYDYITKSKLPNINNLSAREEKFQEILTDLADENSDKLEQFQFKHTSAWSIMIGDSRITEDEIPQYNKVLETIREIIPKAVQDKVDVENNKIKTKWENGDSLFRGVKEQELWDYLTNDNIVGSGKTWKTAGNRGEPFVPTSMSREYAIRHVKEGNGQVLLEFEGGTQDSNPTTYELRGYTEAVDKNNNTFRPNEGFGGTHPIEFLHEEEIQMKKGSKRKLKSVHFLSTEPSDIARFEHNLAQHDASGIEIKYGVYGEHDIQPNTAEAAGTELNWKDAIKSWKKPGDSADSK